MSCEAVERANRTLIFFRVEESAFFVFGFAKNDLGNISDSDLNILKSTAKVTLNLDDEAIEMLVTSGQLTEVTCDENNQQEDETENLQK